jgi:hypothetical protein
VSVVSVSGIGDSCTTFSILSTTLSFAIPVP